MDPAIANKDFDPPAPASLLRRGLVPALLINAVFVLALVWSAPWTRMETSQAVAPARSELGIMGAPAARPEPAVRPESAAPRAPGANVESPTAGVPEPKRAAFPAQSSAAPVPQPGSEYRPVPVAAGRPAERAPVQTAPAPIAPPERVAATRPPAGAADPPPTWVAAITPQQVPVSPSFDCARARSRPEKLICADAELARLDRELGRLNARARSLVDDPAAFRRAGDREWRRREAECGDKACLLAWYAQRREQLQAVVDGRG